MPPRSPICAAPICRRTSSTGSPAMRRGTLARIRNGTDHLRALGLADLRVTPDPVRLSSEAALWGAIAAEGLLAGAVVVSDDAGQFRVGDHALCWVHAERLVHKLVPANDGQ